MDARVQVYSDKMQKAFEFLEADFAAIRAGRANPHVLDKLRVDYYGTPTPIQQVASISTPDPRTLAIQPWDASILRDIERAIQSSDLGINPQNDGRIIRLSFPQLTQERRVELTKQVRKYGENGKVAIRNIRRDAMEDIKKMTKKSELTEDDQKNLEEEMQKITDKFVKEIDKTCEAKNKEIMEI